MSARKLIDGPDQYWSSDVPVSRGQYKDIALVALDLLGVPRPKNRLEATTTMVRLRVAVSEQAVEPGKVPRPW